MSSEPSEILIRNADVVVTMNATRAEIAGGDVLIRPLAKKLGIKEGHTVVLLGAPTGFDATLGETLDGLPGVGSTYFGPNASRPVIRGQDGDRIRVLQESK